MKLWRTIPFAAALAVVQAHTPVGARSSSPEPRPAPQAQPTSVPLYRVAVVHGSTKAINYKNLKFSTKVDLNGTALCPAASGVEIGRAHV